MAKRRPKGQHFLLSAGARTLSLFEALNLSEDEAEARFAAIRWPDSDGNPLTNDVAGFRVGLRDDIRQFLHVGKSRLEGGLNHLSLLRDLVFRRSRNHDLSGSGFGLFN